MLIKLNSHNQPKYLACFYAVSSLQVDKRLSCLQLKVAERKSMDIHGV